VSTVIPALAARLVERWSALPIALEREVDVRRGLPVKGLGARQMILVEFDGDPDARENSTYVQAWIDMACTRKQEVGEIRCTALAQTGDTDIGRMSQLAGELAAACSADLITDITAGGIVWSAAATSGTAQQVKNDDGVAVIVPFTVAYAAPA
jgi:hypothetical protein